MTREMKDPDYYSALRAAQSEGNFSDLGPDFAVPDNPPDLTPDGLARDPLRGLLPEDLVLKEHETKHRLLTYLRQEILPTIFCQGCGGGTVLNTFATAIDEMSIDPKEMICVTGIGCSSWIPSPYFLVDTLHTTHGRAVAFATGVKVMKPDMKVIVIAGDGDLAGIGGNHLIHAARRNLDISVFLVNNFIYGMTGGQVSSTTPFGLKTTTTPYRNVENPFKIADLVAAAGANYVSRWTTYHAFQLMESIQYAIMKPGFSFIEIMSQCPVSFGKAAGMNDAVAILHYLKDRSIHIDDTAGMSEEELDDRIVIGKLAERSQREFGSELRRVNAECEAALREKFGGEGKGHPDPETEPSR